MPARPLRAVVRPVSPLCAGFFISTASGRFLHFWRTEMSVKLRALQAKKAEQVAAARKFNDETDAKAQAESRGWTEEETAHYQAMRDSIVATQASIDREQALITEEAGLQAVMSPMSGGAAGAAAPPASGDIRPRGDASGVAVPAGAHISVEENVMNDPRRGFRSMGEFSRAVRGAAMAAQGVGALDRRLGMMAVAPTTYGNESNGADGGFAVPPAFSQEIWRLSLEDGSLVPMTLNTEVTGNSMIFPKDETTPWGSGVQAYWKGEGSATAQSKMQLGTEMLRLKELMVLVPVTNELLEDAPALGSYLTPLASDRIQWKTNEAILFGTGGAQPQGCMNSQALVVVAKESGQATNTLTQPNISRMRSRLLTGQLKNAIWIGNPDILPALEGMTVGQIPIFLPPGTGLREGGYDGTLNGRPLILSEHAAAFSSQSDLSLISLKGYRTITKAGGLETATSMHLYFDANATAFRFIFRIDGQPVMQAPVTPPTGKSTNTRSYFVTLGAR
ncbi:phage major capsid protein [Burkholderia cepacia]|uniref:phage major capsid protein n=1 Tax=Burkholderia cepacia TaxID=292 RepID=UPI001F45BE55|nr:phage major capsid protein [Burkholderia cepacia]MCE4125762.1 phage major capsid protein [Burkholderia cepacia]